MMVNTGHRVVAGHRVHVVEEECQASKVRQVNQVQKVILEKMENKEYRALLAKGEHQVNQDLLENKEIKAELVWLVVADNRVYQEGEETLVTLFKQFGGIMVLGDLWDPLAFREKKVHRVSTVLSERRDEKELLASPDDRAHQARKDMLALTATSITKL